MQRAAVHGRKPALQLCSRCSPRHSSLRRLPSACSRTAHRVQAERVMLRSATTDNAEARIVSEAPEGVSVSGYAKIKIADQEAFISKELEFDAEDESAASVGEADINAGPSIWSSVPPSSLANGGTTTVAKEMIASAPPLLSSADVPAGPHSPWPRVESYDAAYVSRTYAELSLRVLLMRNGTGFGAARDVTEMRIGDTVAGRYKVLDFLGSAAFSHGVKALDLISGLQVCLKIVKNDKNYFDQSLYEIKLLQMVNEADPDDEHGIVRLYDFFYYKEHLFLVCELLGTNLYEYMRYLRSRGLPRYFALPRVQSVARQVLRSLAFLHAQGLIHCDLKPENILFVSYRRCEVKVIDLGSSRLASDPLSMYVQSRNYRAPEVILGLPHGAKIDLWSLGCILAELLTGKVLFQNESESSLLARMQSLLGPLPSPMLSAGQFTRQFFTRSGRLYQRSADTGDYELLQPAPTEGLKSVLMDADEGLLDLVSQLLQPDPSKRPSAVEALAHPWLALDLEPNLEPELEDEPAAALAAAQPGVAAQE